MKISDLDIETKAVIVWATMLLRNRASDKYWNGLQKAIENFDKAHSEEQVDNLLRGIFGINRDGETVQ